VIAVVQCKLVIGYSCLLIVYEVNYSGCSIGLDVLQ